MTGAVLSTIMDRQHLVPTRGQIRAARREAGVFPPSPCSSFRKLPSSSSPGPPEASAPQRPLQAGPHHLGCPDVWDCHPVTGAGAPGEFLSSPACLSLDPLHLLSWTWPQDREVLCPAFTECFSGIYCNFLPLGCWSADSQRVVFDSAQRSRQVRGPDCAERRPLGPGYARHMRTSGWNTKPQGLPGP